MKKILQKLRQVNTTLHTLSLWFHRMRLRSRLSYGTMDIIKHMVKSQQILDVGGGASKEKVAAAFKLILSDKNVKGILIKFFVGQ